MPNMWISPTQPRTVFFPDRDLSEPDLVGLSTQRGNVSRVGIQESEDLDLLCLRRGRSASTAASCPVREL